MPQRTKPTFEMPPLVEVVCGVHFRTLAAFQAPHYGLFWSKIRKDFPRSRTVVPIGPQLQLPANEPTELTLQVNAPDMPRVWFISEDDTRLVQLQPDRFHLNWREGPKRATYPRYKSVFREFKSLYKKFENFLDDNSIGKPHLLGTSLAYINHIKFGESLRSYGDIGEVFPDLAWRRGSRFLSQPGTLMFKTSHEFNGGDLTVTIRSGKSALEDAPIIRFDIAANGSTAELSDPSDVWDWYDHANASIVDAFIDMTSKNFQRNVWGRRE